MQVCCRKYLMLKFFCSFYSNKKSVIVRFILFLFNLETYFQCSAIVSKRTYISGEKVVRVLAKSKQERHKTTVIILLFPSAKKT